MCGAGELNGASPCLVLIANSLEMCFKNHSVLYKPGPGLDVTSPGLSKDSNSSVYT